MLHLKLAYTAVSRSIPTDAADCPSLLGLGVQKPETLLPWLSVCLCHKVSPLCVGFVEFESLLEANLDSCDLMLWTSTIKVQRSSCMSRCFELRNTGKPSVSIARPPAR